eukprot:m.116214 g.116214  ORF g.116214 m.116214 type:complete len:146 (+) comp12848_c1_seq3:351-788(+)
MNEVQVCVPCEQVRKEIDSQTSKFADMFDKVNEAKMFVSFYGRGTGLFGRKKVWEMWEITINVTNLHEGKIPPNYRETLSESVIHNIENITEIMCKETQHLEAVKKDRDIVLVDTSSPERPYLFEIKSILPGQEETKGGLWNLLF